MTTSDPPAESPEAIFLAMERAADDFYRAAQRIGVHPFLEFTGLMREYITILRASLRPEEPFAWPGDRVRMETFHAQYLAEKLDCIYGNAFEARPELRAVFVEAFLGRTP